MNKINIFKFILVVSAVSVNANANFKDAVGKAARTSGNPVDVMKKVVEITTDEAAVCLALEGEKVYRLHTNKKYDGEVTDAIELPVFKSFFQIREEPQVKYNIMSGGVMRGFIAYKTHIDDTHLCFARVLDKSPTSATPTEEVSGDGPRTPKKKTTRVDGDSGS
jgi:hypothetical protein